MSDLTMLLIFAGIVVVTVAAAEFVRMRCRRGLAEIATQQQRSEPADEPAPEHVG